MKTLSVIGSAGSIGVQTLEVATERGYRVAGLPWLCWRAAARRPTRWNSRF